MKTKRIAAALLCAVLIICSAFSMVLGASAASEAKLNGTYSVENGKLTLTVKLSGNKGINTLVARLSYNAELLALDSVENGEVFSEKNNGSMFPTNTENNPLVLYFEENGIGNITANGVAATLVFTVKTESKDYGFELTVDGDNTFAVGEGIVPVDVPFAKSTVSEFAGLPGDISGDGRVNSVDLNLMKRMILATLAPTPERTAAADLSNDGRINVVDLALLQRIVLGMS